LGIVNCRRLPKKTFKIKFKKKKIVAGDQVLRVSSQISKKNKIRIN